jgi:hypothetical protein
MHHDGFSCLCCVMHLRLRLTPSSRKYKEILRKRKPTVETKVACPI